MLKFKVFYIIPTCCVIFLVNCYAPQTQLQRVDISGPMYKTPIKITSNKKIHDIEIRPYFAVNTSEIIEGKTWHYTGSEEYNFYWDLSNSDGGVEIDLTIAKQLALTYGVNYTSTKRRDLWGNSFGFGYFSAGISNQQLFDVHDNYSNRLDHTSSFRFITAGFYRNLGQTSRSLTGLRIIQERSFKKDHSLSYIPELFFQVDFRFKLQEE